MGDSQKSRSSPQVVSINSLLVLNCFHVLLCLAKQLLLAASVTCEEDICDNTIKPLNKYYHAALTANLSHSTFFNASNPSAAPKPQPFQSHIVPETLFPHLFPTSPMKGESPKPRPLRLNFNLYPNPTFVLCYITTSNIV